MRIRTRPLVLASIAVVVVLLAGRASSETQDTPLAEYDILAEYDLSGLSGREIVDQLDASSEARPLAFSASVGQDEVLIGDASTQVAIALPEDEQYVSIAPFIDRTHECYYHSLATCQGELPGAEVSITVSDDHGEVLVDEVTRTYSNGFVGVWLPRDIRGTIEVTYGDYTGRVPLSTADGSPTCVTTLQLSRSVGG